MRDADTTAGDPVPSEEELFPTMTAEEVAAFDNYSVDEMMQFINKKSELKPTHQPFSIKGEFLQYNLSGDETASDDFLIKSRDDACIFAYQMDTGGRVPLHKRQENQVLVNMEGGELQRWNSLVCLPGR